MLMSTCKLERKVVSLQIKKMEHFIDKIKILDDEIQPQISDMECAGWRVFSRRFVAFMDIAGYKATNHYGFYSYSLAHALKNIANEEQERYVERIDINNMNEYLYIVSISDSVVVISKDDSIESFCCFCHAVGRIFNKCILLGRFMTAAMACGQTYVDKEKIIFGGVAYDKAYNLQEQMDYYGILSDPSIIDYFTQNINCLDENYLCYKKHFYDVEYYLKPNRDDDTSIKTGKRLNYFWYDRLPYGYVVYSKIMWGLNEIKLCASDENGVVAGNYEEHITNVIENYGEENIKIKKRLNHTMDVLEYMLKYQSYNYKQKFTRYEVQ